MFAKSLTTDPLRITVDKTTIAAGEELTGTVTMYKLISNITKDPILDNHHLCMQFHGVERTAKATNVLICEQVYLTLSRETSTTLEYSFRHTLGKDLIPSVSFHDHKILYQVAVRLENESLDPRLVAKMHIEVTACAKPGQVSNNVYHVRVPELVIEEKSNFHIKAINPKFSNITSVDYKLVRDGKTVFKNQLKLKGCNPEVDPSFYLDAVKPGQYLMSLTIKDLRSTNKFEIPVLVHQRDSLPVYSAL